MLIDHPENFGARDRLTCTECGGDTILIRRSPHPEFGSSFETQVFRCLQCDRELTRSADVAGKPHS